jgi:fatty acid desaturase
MKQLPEGYIRLETLDLMQDQERLRQMVVWGTVSLVVLLVLFWWLAARLRPDALWILGFQGAGFFATGGVLFLWLASLVVATLLMIVLHEAVHGVFFWLFSGKIPLFGFKGFYAYAALPPGVYLERDRYLLTGIAPLLVLTAAGLALVPFIPALTLPVLLFFLVGNASGSVGDVIVIGWLLSKPPEVLIEDNGAVMTVYGPL